MSEIYHWCPITRTLCYCETRCDEPVKGENMDMMKDALDVASTNAVTARKALEQRDALVEAARPFLEAFDYDPGHSDLDNEQPIAVHVTLGDWRRLSMALKWHS